MHLVSQQFVYFTSSMCMEDDIIPCKTIFFWKLFINISLTEHKNA